MNSVISKYRVEASVVIVVLLVLAIVFALTRSQHNRTAEVSSSAERTQSLSQQGADETAYSLDVLIVAGKSLTVNQDPNPKVTVPAGQGLRLVGWAIDRASNSVAGGVSAQIDRGAVIDGSYGGVRPDVAVALKNDALKGSSFAIDVPAKDLPHGNHSISLRIMKSDRSGYYLVKDKVAVTVD